MTSHGSSSWMIAISRLTETFALRWAGSEITRGTRLRASCVFVGLVGARLAKAVSTRRLSFPSLTSLAFQHH
jgi:hypothetical protein